ncbi:unnamed protein product, partial [Brassica rapa subsp. trilocularis]
IGRPDQNPAVSHAQSAPGPIGIPSQLPMTGAASNQPSKWTSELFDCMNDGENALITCFFPFITFGQIAEVIDEGTSVSIYVNEPEHVDTMCLLMHIPDQTLKQICATGCSSSRLDHSLLL